MRKLSEERKLELRSNPADATTLEDYAYLESMTKAVLAGASKRFAEVAKTPGARFWTPEYGEPGGNSFRVSLLTRQGKRLLNVVNARVGGELLTLRELRQPNSLEVVCRLLLPGVVRIEWDEGEGDEKIDVDYVNGLTGEEAEAPRRIKRVTMFSAKLIHRLPDGGEDSYARTELFHEKGVAGCHAVLQELVRRDVRVTKEDLVRLSEARGAWKPRRREE